MTMKDMDYRLLCTGLLAGLFLSCMQRETDVRIDSEDVFYASLEQPMGTDTRVYADEDLMILWHADDRVSVFDWYTYNQEYRYMGETGENAGTLVKVPNEDFVTGNALDHIYAVYPYQASTRISNTGVLTMTLPSEQIYAENNMAQGSNSMISVTDGKNLRFKNLCGYLVLKLYGEGVSVSSVTVKGNANEPLSGKATVSMPVDGYPTLVIQPASATREVILTCPTPVLLGATAEAYKEFWFVLPPTDFTGGITVTVTGPDGSTFEKSTSNRIDIERNELNRMAPLEVVLEGRDVPPNNEIWYTTSNGQIVEPYVKEGFGANIVSNTYVEGKGILAFDGDVDMIPAHAFRSKHTLNGMLLPESVTAIGDMAFEFCFFDSFFIPERVISVGVNPFAQCLYLHSFYGKYATDDHLTLVDGNKLLSFAIGNKLPSYTIPDGIEIIGAYSLDRSQIDEIILPEGIRVLEEGALSSCVFSDINLPQSLIEIGGYALSGCYYLESITIPDSVETIGDNPFMDAFNLTAFYGKYSTEDHRCLIHGDKLVSFAVKGISQYMIPEGVKTIGTRAFIRSYLESLIIPSSVTDIGNFALQECNYLQTITFPSRLERLGYYSVYNCELLSSVRMLSEVPPIGSYYMFDNTNDCPIYVPAASVDAYKTAQYWQTYADRIFPIESSKPVPEAVDLGLPSGLKWASCNLGATKPEEFGDYFAWGETEPYYSIQDPLTWKPDKEAGYYWPSYRWCMGPETRMTKYCQYANYGNEGFTDDKTVLDPEDDAAHVNLGGNWRMPTDAEMCELMDNCTWEWTIQNDVNGRLVTGSNGNSIFLPAAGNRYNARLYSAGSGGYYWSSSLTTDTPLTAYEVRFYSDSVRRSYDYRDGGLPIRPVTD